MFLVSVLEICSKLTGEHPCRSAVSVKLLCNFIDITFRHGYSPVNLLHISRTPFPKNTSGWLLLRLHWNNCVDFKITASIFLRIWLYICVLHHSKRLGEEGVGSVTVNFDSSSGIVLMLNTNNISLLLKFFTVLEQKAVKEN